MFVLWERGVLERLSGHVGYHLLSEHIFGYDICRFCGERGCSNQLKKKYINMGKFYYKLDSKCVYFFEYKRIPTYPKRQKCSKYLAKCEAKNCNRDVWKYNMNIHYKEKHPLLKFPERFLNSEDEKKSISFFKF